MFNLLRKENFLLFYLRFKKYGVWFFINFIIATIPFAIMFARNYSTETLFSNFLSFNFGLIISPPNRVAITPPTTSSGRSTARRYYRMVSDQKNVKRVPM